MYDVFMLEGFLKLAPIILAALEALYYGVLHDGMYICFSRPTNGRDEHISIYSKIAYKLDVTCFMQACNTTADAIGENKPMEIVCTYLFEGSIHVAWALTALESKHRQNLNQTFPYKVDLKHRAAGSQEISLPTSVN